MDLYINSHFDDSIIKFEFFMVIEFGTKANSVGCKATCGSSPHALSKLINKLASSSFQSQLLV